MDLATDILRLADKVAQVPGLGITCSLAMQIIKTVQISKNNTTRIQYLARSIVEYRIRIAELMEGRWDNAPHNLRRLLDEFESVLQDIYKSVARHAKSHRIIAFINAGDRQTDINRLEKHLEDVQRSILGLLGIDASVVLHTIEAGIDRVFIAVGSQRLSDSLTPSRLIHPVSSPASTVLPPASSASSRAAHTTLLPPATHPHWKSPNPVLPINPSDDDHEQSMSDNLLETGSYTITNARFKNFAVLSDDNEYSDIVAGSESHNGSEKWNVMLLNSERYTIKNHGFAKFAGYNERPAKGVYVCGRKCNQEWVIKETRVEGQFTISPTDANVFWGLEDSEIYSPIILAGVPNDPKNQWIFTKTSA